MKGPSVCYAFLRQKALIFLMKGVLYRMKQQNTQPGHGQATHDKRPAHGAGQIQRYRPAHGGQRCGQIPRSSRVHGGQTYGGGGQTVRRRRGASKSRLGLLPFLLPVFGCCVLLFLLLRAVPERTGSCSGEPFSSGAETGGQADLSIPAGTEKISDGTSDSAAADQTETAGTDTPWYLTLVNRWNPLPEGYPLNLTDVPGGERVDERIYEPLMEMLEAAREANWDQLPMVVSGYRTQEKQQELYDEKIAEFRKKGCSEEEAVRQAEQWVAKPGCSEHQLGFAVDINGATYDLYLWLQENSYKYGFIFRYPGSKTDLTGTAEEVWHYRYVGREAAAQIYEQGICLEEYLEGAQDERAQDDGTDDAGKAVGEYHLQNGEWVLSQK